MGKMYTNIIHRADRGESFEGLIFQQNAVHKVGLQSTILMSYPALYDEQIIRYVKGQQDEFGDEIGLHFHMLQCPEFYDRYKSRENALYLYPLQVRKEIIDHIFEKFRTQFGFIPSAIGGYLFDADTIHYIKEKYQEVTAVIATCFEEGVNMYQGCNHNWNLFSEGGPWGAYRPSNKNSFCPAKTDDEAVQLVCLPHLNRDMLMAVCSRDDYFSSHPANVMRGKAHEGKTSHYLKRFVDQWIEQTAYNEWVYYSLFVSSPWVMEGNIFDEDYEEARALYEETLGYLRQKADEGLAAVTTMTEFAHWYMQTVKTGTPEFNIWNDIICGSKRQVIWYAGPEKRLTIDCNLGGAITDIRPYAGRIDRNIGLGSENGYIASYPYIVNFQQRGGFMHSASLNVEGGSTGLSLKRTKAEKVVKSAEGTEIILKCATVSIKSAVVAVQTSFLFKTDGDLYIKRKIVSLQGADSVKLTECFNGTYGSTQYPEDMTGITFEVNGNPNEGFVYSFTGKSIEKIGNHMTSIMIPQVHSRIAFVPVTAFESCAVEDGTMFFSNYVMRQTATLKENEESVLCVKIESL